MSRFQRSFVLIVVTVALIASTLLSGCLPGCQQAEQFLRVNLGGNPTNLDPQKTSSGRDLSVIVQVFDGLLGFNQDLTLKPVVASEVPSTENGGISQDGLTYTFKLRTDVTWSDGTQVTAQDFVYAINRLLDPSTGADYAYLYTDIANVRAVDDYTLEITLSSQVQSFLQRMALWAVYPIRQDIVQQYGDNWAASPETYIGNGPFKLKEWVIDDHLTLERNPNYWGTPAELEGIRYAMYEDDATEYLTYQAGDLDITRVPVGTERTVAGSPELLSYSRLKTNALFFDCGESEATAPPNPFFDNAKLRQAFAMAIDCTALVDDLQGGRGSVTYCWIPAGMPGYEAGYQQTCGSQWAVDATKAKQALADAGYPNGQGLPDITLLYSNVGSNPIIAQFIQGQITNNLGVNIDVVGVGSAVFYSRLKNERDKWDLAYASFSADYPDPDNWLPDFFTTDGVYNKRYFAQYSNSQVDGKVAQALAQADEAQRLTLWKEAEAIMVGDAPAIFLFNDEMFVLKKPRVKGIVGTAMDLYIPGDLFMADVYLA